MLHHPGTTCRGMKDAYHFASVMRPKVSTFTQLSSRTSAQRARRSGIHNPKEMCEARWSTILAQLHPPRRMDPGSASGNAPRCRTCPGRH